MTAPTETRGAPLAEFPFSADDLIAKVQGMMGFDIMTYEGGIPDRRNKAFNFKVGFQMVQLNFRFFNLNTLQAFRRYSETIAEVGFYVPAGGKSDRKHTDPVRGYALHGIDDRGRRVRVSYRMNQDADPVMALEIERDTREGFELARADEFTKVAKAVHLA